MNVAAAAQEKLSEGKTVVPSAVLYYHVDDPIVDGKNDLSPDDINEMVRQELRTTGLVNDDPTVIQLLDEGLTAKSDVIPVAYKKDGTLSSLSQVISAADYDAVSRFTTGKIKEFGKRILQGDIEVNPYEQGNKESCTYCSYRSICGYDEKIPGYVKRKLEVTDDAAMQLIRNLVDESKDDHLTIEE